MLISSLFSSIPARICLCNCDLKLIAGPFKRLLHQFVESGMKGGTIISSMCFCAAILLVAKNLVQAQNNTPEYYKLSSHEIQALLERRDEYRKSISVNQPLPTDHIHPQTNTSVFEDMKFIVDGDAFCDAQFTIISEVRVSFTFRSARCFHTGNERAHNITCNSFMHRLNPMHEAPGPPLNFINWCPEDHICQNLDEGFDDDGNEIHKVECVHENDVAIEWIYQAEAVLGSPTTGLMHCSDDEMVPLLSHPMAPSGGVLAVLTEEAMYPKGAPYKSPIMLIREKSNRYLSDRAYKRGASVATAIIPILSDHGRLQQRKIQFCMEIVPQIRGFHVIFLHSWFIMASRRGKIPERLSSTENLDYTYSDISVRQN